MRLCRIFLCVIFAASTALAQSPQNWFPPVLENLAQTASSKTEFSLDHSMLVLASKADQDDDSIRRVIAGVDGISVHRFRFQNGGMYDPRILSAVRQAYSSAGWQHLADAHAKYGYPQATDVWLHMQNNTIRNIDVMLTGRDQVNFVAVSGSISPLDLLRLAGHFGIPRMQGGVAVPAPGTTGPLPPAAGGPPAAEPSSAGPAGADPSNLPPPAEDNSAPQPNSAPGADDDYRHPNGQSQPAPPSAPPSGEQPR